jgi:hypothetical protein
VDLRLSLTSAVALAVLASFAKAPFDHIHRHDAEHRHARGLSHVHASQLFHSKLAMHAADDDDDVQSLEWILLVDDSAHPFLGVVAEAIAVPAPEQRHGLVRMPAPCAHDPPFLDAGSSRAPPA